MAKDQTLRHLEGGISVFTKFVRISVVVEIFQSKLQNENSI